MDNTKRIRENTEGNNVIPVFESYDGGSAEGGAGEGVIGDDSGGLGGGASNPPGRTTARREQVRRACVRCAGSKRKCSGVFPCDRCIRLGNGDSCVEVQLKRKGMSNGTDNLISRLPASGVETAILDIASSRKRRLPEAGGVPSLSSNNAWPVLAMNGSHIDGSISTYGLQPGGVLFDPVSMVNHPGMIGGFAANSFGQLSMPPSPPLGYPSAPIIPQTRFPHQVAFDVGQLPPPPRDLEVSVDSTKWNMSGVLGHDLSGQVTLLRDSRLSSLGVSSMPIAAPRALLTVAQPAAQDFKRELSTEDVLDLQLLNLAPSSRLSGSRQTSRDSPQKDLWSPDAEESRIKNGLMRSEMSGYSGHRISEEFLDGLKLPDLRRESSSSSRISLVSSPIAPLLAEGSQNVVMIRSTGAVMVISRDEPTMYVSNYAKPFSIIKSSTLNINATESLDKLLPFPCIRFGFQDLGAPLFGRAESGIQALGYPTAFSANSEARRLLNLGDDPELKDVLILAKLTVEAPLWVLPNIAPLRAEIIRHTVFHRGTYCEVLGQYSRRFFKETSKILDSTISSALSEKGMNIAPFSCHERIILDYYPSGSIKSCLSVFTTVEDIV